MFLPSCDHWPLILHPLSNIKTRAANCEGAIFPMFLIEDEPRLCGRASGDSGVVCIVKAVNVISVNLKGENVRWCQHKRYCLLMYQSCTGREAASLTSCLLCMFFSNELWMFLSLIDILELDYNHFYRKLEYFYHISKQVGKENI